MQAGSTTTSTAEHFGPAGLRLLTMAVVWALLVSVCALVGVRPVSASVGSAGVDWWAASQLPPIESSAPGGPVLVREEVGEIDCIGDGVCIAATTRPQLTADVEPDDDGLFRFVVFDLTGAGGITSAAAEHVGDDAQWAPPAGLLTHGHEYVWTVIGGDGESQDYQKFVVDLQRYDDQPRDEAGVVGVGLGSGAVFAHVGVPVGDGEGLALGYTTPGASTPSMLPDGWSVAGEALEAVSYTHVEAFAGGETVLLHGLDGTVTRYDTDEDGAYLAPSVNGVDLGFLYPEVSAVGVGWVVVDLSGTVSTFAADGNLARVEAKGLDGTVQADVDVVARGGRLLSVTDGVTGRQLSFGYLGDRGCRPPGGFDRGSGESRVCSITGFDGTVTNLSYVNGRLARVETAGATLDIAYDGSGRLVEVREPAAADAVAAGVREDDASVRWGIDYDKVGRVERVTSPDPTPGAVPLVRTYNYQPGTTTVFVQGDAGPRQATTVTFDPHGLRPYTQAVAGQSPTTYLYNDAGSLTGWVDPTGLQTTLHRDPDTATGTIYGPAPTHWFDQDGLPLDAYTDKVGARTGSNGAGAGMHAWFYDTTTAGGTAPVAMRLVEDGDIAVPDVIDTSSGWRMTGSGDLPVGDDTQFRVTTHGADAEVSSLVVNGTACDLGEPCQVDTGDAAPARVLVFVDLHAPPGQASVSLGVERSDDGGDWVDVPLGEMTGHDLPTTDSHTDVYHLGGDPVTVVEETIYDDVSIGGIGGYTIDGQPVLEIRNEAADPHNDQWARPETILRPSGLTTTLQYWGSTEYATHPLTGEPLLQAGARKTIQLGDGTVYTAIYDNAGRPIATLADGQLIEAVVLDERGRTQQVSVPASATTPAREDRYVYGANGDPQRTDIAHSIGDDSYVTSVTIDLLGRTVNSTDPWGATTHTSHNTYGDTTTMVTTTPTGVTTTRSLAWDRQGIVEEHIVAADSSTYTATVVDRDTAGRATTVAYSNGVTLQRSFDPATGTPTNTHTDTNGGTWTETITTTTQTGRILAHRFDTPTTSAAYTYTYDPTSAQLTNATLDVTGDHTLDATWTYTNTYNNDLCTTPTAVLDGARAHTTTTINGATTTTTTCYDTNGAPTHQHHSDTHDVPITVDNGAVVAYGDLSLGYDATGQLTHATDPTTTITLVRTADSSIIQQTTTVDGVDTVVRYANGGLRLDHNNNPTTQTLQLADTIINIPLNTDDATWSYTSHTGNNWWTSDNGGTPTTTTPTLYTPDGQPLHLDNPDHSETGTGHGWKHQHNGHTLDLDTPVVIFGARTYLPDLASFTTPDPQAHGGTTPYNYANGDPINLVDPTGHAPKWAQDLAKWLDDIPWWAEVFFLGVIIVASLVPILGVGLAAGLAIVMAGYYALKSFSAFANGDIGAGFWYLAEVLLMVVVVYKLYKVAKAGQTMITTSKSTKNKWVKRYNNVTSKAQFDKLQHKANWKLKGTTLWHYEPVTVVVHHPTAWVVMSFGIASASFVSISTDRWWDMPSWWSQ